MTNDVQIEIPFARTDTYKNLFFVRTSMKWNKVSNNIVQAPPLENFKGAITASLYTFIKVSNMQCSALLATTFRRFRMYEAYPFQLLRIMHIRHLLCMLTSERKSNG